MYIISNIKIMMNNDNKKYDMKKIALIVGLVIVIVVSFIVIDDIAGGRSADAFIVIDDIIGG